MSRIRPHYRFAQLVCQIAYAGLFQGRMFGMRHVPRDGGVLLVSNHQSFLDPMLITLGLPRECSYMARDSLFKTEAFGRLISAYNAFPVKRGTADIGAIKESLRRLKAGHLLTMFPEGTRTCDGQIGPMQTGPVMIARRADVPIVPATILGAFEAWPRSAKLPRLKPVIVSYAPPIPPDRLRALGDDRAAEHIRDQIVGMFERYRHHRLFRTT